MDCTMNDTMSERKMMTDLLCSEKYMTGVYNTYCCEAATSAVKSNLIALLQDEHRMQEEVFAEMHARGWYPTEKAEDAKLTQEKQKFGATVTV